MGLPDARCPPEPGKREGIQGDVMTQQIWNEILDSERVVRYFQRRADQLRWRGQVFTVLVIVAASGAAASILASLPDALSAGILFMVACISVWLHFADYSGKATAAKLFSVQYRAYADEWAELWYGDPTMTDVTALRRKGHQIGLGCDIPTDHKLNEKCAGEVYQVVPEQFAATAAQARSPA